MLVKLLKRMSYKLNQLQRRLKHKRGQLGRNKPKLIIKKRHLKEFWQSFKFDFIRCFTLYHRVIVMPVLRKANALP